MPKAVGEHIVYEFNPISMPEHAMIRARNTPPLRCITLIACAWWFMSCESNSTPAASETTISMPTIAEQKPHDYEGLHNVVAFHDGVLSGSVPEDDEGFETLAGMGIQTIISVDGAVPDVDTARARGLRYIHLPIGYNGFDDDRKLELVRATRDAMKDGPVYIHCHHGKHRSAGAAGTIIAALGWATPEEMVQRMKVSGTSSSYKGLYACTQNAVVIAPEAIDAMPAEFPEVSRPEGLVKGMVEIDYINEHLKAIQKANWRVPRDHPDLVPVAEAGRMADLFRLLHDDERVKNKPAEMLEMLAADGELIQELEHMLDTDEPDVEALDLQWEMIQAGCKDCHVKFRD